MRLLFELLPGLMAFLIDRTLQNAFTLAPVAKSVGYFDWVAYSKLFPLASSLFLLLSIYFLTKYLPQKQEVALRLRLGFSFFAGGVLSNAFSLSLRGFSLDYILLPSIGVALNVADLAIFSGLVLYSFGLSPVLIDSITVSWHAKGKERP